MSQRYEYEHETVVFKGPLATLPMALTDPKVTEYLRRGWRILQVFDRGQGLINDERGPNKPAYFFEFIFEKDHWGRR